MLKWRRRFWLSYRICTQASRYQNLLRWSSLDGFRTLCIVDLSPTGQQGSFVRLVLHLDPDGLTLCFCIQILRRTYAKLACVS